MTKYETPELTALMPAINAVQGFTQKHNPGTTDQPLDDVNEAPIGAYQDWE